MSAIAVFDCDLDRHVPHHILQGGATSYQRRSSRSYPACWQKLIRAALAQLFIMTSILLALIPEVSAVRPSVTVAGSDFGNGSGCFAGASHCGARVSAPVAAVVHS